VKLFPILVPPGDASDHAWMDGPWINQFILVATQYTSSTPYVYGGSCSVELVSGSCIRTPYRMWRVTGGT
jgi:hypothetical protein